jgi:hypothetical protein
MKRSEVRAFVKSAVKETDDIKFFDSGRLTEFNSKRSIIYPAAWLVSPEKSRDLIDSMPFDDWSIDIHIAFKDAVDSIPEQYESLVDEADLIANKVLKNINDVVDGYKTVTITSISSTPWIKQNADCLTGVILSMTINIPDETNLC